MVHILQTEGSQGAQETGGSAVEQTVGNGKTRARGQRAAKRPRNSSLSWRSGNNGEHTRARRYENNRKDFKIGGETRR